MATSIRTTPDASGDMPTAPTPEGHPAGDRPVRTAADTLRILHEYEAFPPGSPERGAVMRREGIHTSQISQWRKQRDRRALEHLAPQPRGPKPTPPNPLADEVARLRTENARLQARLNQAELVIDVQKKWRNCLVPISQCHRRTSGHASQHSQPSSRAGRRRGMSRAGHATQRLLSGTGSERFHPSRDTRIHRRGRGESHG